MFLVKLDTATHLVLEVTPLDATNPQLLTQLDDSYVLSPTEPVVGEKYDPVNKLFGQPLRKRWITKLAFRQRMTGAERVALKQAQLLPTREVDETDAAYSARCSIPFQLQDMDDLLTDARYIDLGRADTRQMVQALEALQLLAPGRALEILDGEIAEHEYFPEA